MITVTFKTFEQNGEHYNVSDDIAGRLPADKVRTWKFGYVPLDTKEFISIGSKMSARLEEIAGIQALSAVGAMAILQPYVAQAERVLAIHTVLKEWDWTTPADDPMPITLENLETLPYRVLFKLGNIILGRDLPDDLIAAIEADAKAKEKIQKEKNG